MEVKHCSKCGKVYAATTDNFHKHCRRRDGLSAWCKNCRAEDDKKYRQANREIVLLRAREYHRKHPQQALEASRRYQKLHPERCALASKKNREKYPERRKESIRKYNAKKVESRQERIAHSIRSRIGFSLRGGKRGRSWESLVGYTLNDLMVHLESQFTRGMTWGDYGRGGWHIDHIRPISDFNFADTGDPEFRECWSLWNLQPLWESENVIKNAKCDEPPLPLLPRRL